MTPRSTLDREIRIASVYSTGKYTPEEILRFAAYGPSGTQDPVDLALQKETGAQVAEDYIPANPERRFSLAEVPTEHGKQLVMRGDAASVINNASMDKEARQKFQDNYEAARIIGHRMLTVAVADVDRIGQKTPYFVEGFVALGVDKPDVHGDSTANEWVRVSLWTRSLRFQHWANVLLIIIMSLTGYFIMDPFFGGRATNPAEVGYLMGWIRGAHFLAGFLWTAMGVWRVSLLCFSKERQLRWRALWPLDSMRDVEGFKDTLLYYCFLKKQPAHYLAHNPLQQFAYTAIYVLCVVQLLSGLALFGLYEQGNWIWMVLSYPVHWFGVPFFRLLHAALMFVLWAFVILHVYLAIRADTQEVHGGVSSMFNGGVWVRKGAIPLDAHRVGRDGLKL